MHESRLEAYLDWRRAHWAMRRLSAMMPLRPCTSSSGRGNSSPSRSGLSVDGVSVAEKTDDVHPEESPESLDRRRSSTELFCLKFSTKCSMSSSMRRCTNSGLLLVLHRGSSLSGLDSMAMAWV